MKNIMIITSLLAGINGAAKAVTPQDLLPDGQDKATINGVTVRKGSIASLIENVRLLNEMLLGDKPTEGAQGLMDDIRVALPVQKTFHVFDVFSVEDWISNGGRPGNVLAGVLYLQQYPNAMTDKVHNRLVALSQTAHPVLRNEIAKLI